MRPRSGRVDVDLERVANRVRQSLELMRCPHCHRHRFVYDPKSGTIQKLEETTPEPRNVVEALRAGRVVSDADFDSMYRPAVRELSQRHFTPVAVARRAAELLVSRPGARILDVGSGAGKFCLVGALTTGGTFHGVERSRRLVDAARRVVVLHGVPRTHFIHGDLASLEWAGFDGFYLFNPFANDGVEPFALNSADREGYIDLVRNRLGEQPSGTRVVCYHGIGGTMARGYRLIQVEGQGADLLELWIKGSWPGAS